MEPAEAFKNSKIAYKNRLHKESRGETDSLVCLVPPFFFPAEPFFLELSLTVPPSWRDVLTARGAQL